MKKLFYISLLLATVFACDTIDENERYLPMPQPERSLRKRVLLEDYTGHMCVNCPYAAEEVVKLKERYGDTLIVVSVHAGGMAMSVPGVFQADYRTKAGEEYAKAFNITVNPSGLFDRSTLNGMQIFTDYQNWEAYVGMRRSVEPPVDITVYALWNPEIRKVTSFANIEGLQETDREMALQFWLIENDIISPQIVPHHIDPSEIVMDYHHNHVLRDAMNGTWGAPLSAVGVGAIRTETAEIVLPDEWKEKDCRVVAFVYDKATYEILQVAETPVTGPAEK